MYRRHQSRVNFDFKAYLSYLNFFDNYNHTKILHKLGFMQDFCIIIAYCELYKYTDDLNVFDE